MSKLPAYISLIILLVSCSKSKLPEGENNPPVNYYKIRVVDGENQTATIGSFLKSIVVQTADTGNIPRYVAYFEFETINCQNQPVIEKSNAMSGTGIFAWKLNGTIGIQKLKVTSIDAVGKRRDSIEIPAIGTAPQKGWNYSACLPTDATRCLALKQLKTGRLFACVDKVDFLYYSDDNAATWQPLQTFPKDKIKDIEVTPDDEIFITNGASIFYSFDGGTSWQERKNDKLVSKNSIDKLAYTRSGILFCNDGWSSFSYDKGLNWKTDANISAGGLRDPQSLSDGFLLGINVDELMVKATQANWTRSHKLSFSYRPTALWVDADDSLFICIYNGLNNKVEIMKTDGHLQGNLQTIFSTRPGNSTITYIQKLTKENDGFYYFIAPDGKLIKTADFSTYKELPPPQPYPYIYNYQIARNGAIVATTAITTFPISYYLP